MTVDNQGRKRKLFIHGAHKGGEMRRIRFGRRGLVIGILAVATFAVAGGIA